MKKNITFTSGAYKLVGRIYFPLVHKHQQPALIYLHGWTSSQDKNPQYVEALSKLGFICMTMDLPGHGLSEGELTTISRSEFLSAVTAAFDKLADMPEVDKHNISAIGSSFGAYLAVLLAAQRPLSNLALRVPANYPDEGFNDPHVKFAAKVETKQWREVPLNPRDNRALSALNKFKGKVLIIESENDDIIPRQAIVNYANALANRAQLTHVVMEGAPHSLSNPRHLAACQKILTDWFKDKV